MKKRIIIGLIIIFLITTSSALFQYIKYDRVMILKDLVLPPSNPDTVAISSQYYNSGSIIANANKNYCPYYFDGFNFIKIGLAKDSSLFEDVGGFVQPKTTVTDAFKFAGTLYSGTFSSTGTTTNLLNITSGTDFSNGNGILFGQSSTGSIAMRYLTAFGGVLIGDQSSNSIMVIRPGGTVFTSTSNVGISLSPSAVVQLNSTTKGFLPPVMTTAQMNAISSPATGLIVFVSDAIPSPTIYIYNGTAWTAH